MSGKLKPGRLPRQHLVLAHRKQVVARLLLTRNLDANPLPINGEGIEIFRQIRKDGLQEADHVTWLRDSGCCLDAHLKAVLKALRRTTPESIKCLEQIIANFEEEVNKIDCVRSRHGEINDCTSRDADLAPGTELCACWKPLQELFDIVLKNTEKYYRRYAHGFVQAPDIEVIYSTRPTRDSEPRAMTDFPKDDSLLSRKSTAIIYLPVSNFDASCYFELIYDLFHEIVVHAPQAMATVGRRHPYGEDCPFSEGLVDAAAYHIACKVLRSNAALPETIASFADRFCEKATLKHQERSNYQFSDPSSSKPEDDAEIAARHARARGREIFWSLLKLRSAGRKKNDAWVLKLILSLNLQSLSKQQRLNLITGLSKTMNLKKMGIPPTKFQENRLHALDRYVQEGDLKTLLEAFGCSSSDKPDATY